MRVEKLVVNGQEHLLYIHFEDRKDVSCSLGKKGVNIHVPLALTREQQFQSILKMKKWVMKKLMKNPKIFKKHEQKEYKSGDMLKISDEEFLLNIMYSDKQSSSAQLRGSTIFLNISGNLSEEQKKKHVSALLSRIVGRKRLPTLEKKIKELNEKHFQMRFKKIFFKNVSSRWGSCSHTGNINISTRLLFAPDDVLESVCVHELAHLIEHNHSDRFWELVKKAMPDYDEKRKWLDEHGEGCVF